MNGPRLLIALSLSALAITAGCGGSTASSPRGSGGEASGGPSPAALSVAYCQTLKPGLATLAPDEILDVENSGPLQDSELQVFNTINARYNAPKVVKYLTCQTMSKGTPAGSAASVVVAAADRPFASADGLNLAKAWGGGTWDPVSGIGDWAYTNVNPSGAGLIFAKDRYLVRLRTTARYTRDEPIKAAKQVQRVLASG